MIDINSLLPQTDRVDLSGGIWSRMFPATVPGERCSFKIRAILPMNTDHHQSRPDPVEGSRSGQSGPVRVVALIGAGLIGASWAAYFLAKGIGVRVFDPAHDASARLRRTIEESWPAMVAAGIAQGSAPECPPISASIEVACAGADLVIENGPESPDAKRALIAQIDAATAPHVIIGSSSSSLMPSDYQADALHPERVLATHPFNPPALIPLVEVAGGRLTDPAAVTRALDLFRALGKVPIEVRRESPGLVANRMTAALYREAVHLVATGVASVEDVDVAIAWGPGLRWAAFGPHMLYHLGGGEGGYRHYLDHLGPAQERRWATLQSAPLDEPVKQRLIDGVERSAAGRSLAELEAERDRLLAAILALKQANGA